MIGGLVARHTIQIVRAPVIDDGRGNETEDWPNAVDTPSKGWAIDAGDTTENQDGRDSTTAEWTLRGPYAAEVRSSDHVKVLGVECEIVGAVLRQPGPTPRTSHTILRLRSVTG